MNAPRYESCQDCEGQGLLYGGAYYNPHAPWNEEGVQLCNRCSGSGVQEREPEPPANDEEKKTEAA